MLGIAGTAPGLVMPVDGSRRRRAAGRAVRAAPAVGGWRPTTPRWPTSSRAPEPRAPLAHAHVRHRRVACRRPIRSGRRRPARRRDAICARSFEIEIDIRADPGGRGRPRRRSHERMRGRARASTCSRPTSGRWPRSCSTCSRSRAGRARPPSRAPAGWSPPRLTDIAGQLGRVHRRRGGLLERAQARLLGVPADVLDEHGAVSAEAAAAMARGRARAPRSRRGGGRDRDRRARAAAARRSRWGSSTCTSRRPRARIARRMDIPGGRAMRCVPGPRPPPCSCCARISSRTPAQPGPLNRVRRRLYVSPTNMCSGRSAHVGAGCDNTIGCALRGVAERNGGVDAWSESRPWRRPSARSSASSARARS